MLRVGQKNLWILNYFHILQVWSVNLFSWHLAIIILYSHYQYFYSLPVSNYVSLECVSFASVLFQCICRNEYIFLHAILTLQLYNVICDNEISDWFFKTFKFQIFSLLFTNVFEWEFCFISNCIFCSLYLNTLPVNYKQVKDILLNERRYKKEAGLILTKWNGLLYL